ncbi:MAG: fumarate hydratase [Coriobacteriales bacterium]|jgi:tartrate dehydratase alpha subunit/fumarate hydratase class I-like protein|nr:fumarate hydratase [Coriobacteriales bacterium]
MNNAPIIIDAHTIAEKVAAAVSQLASKMRPDFLAGLEAAQTTEQTERGREVLAQLVKNARMASTESLPLCQDTGYVWVFLEFAGPVAVRGDIFSEVDAAVAEVYQQRGLRMSMVRDALCDRSNSGDNTPAFCELYVTSASEQPAKWPGEKPGDERPTNAQPAEQPDEGEATSDTTGARAQARLHVMLKGGGSDNASALAMLPPSAGRQGVVDFVLAAVRDKGASACPPLLVGVGVGTTFDKVGALAKRALLRKVGSINANPEAAALEAELLIALNDTGIGPGGLGGTTTALAVHVNTAPCHIAALPVAVNLGCCALRSISIDML